MPYSGCFGYLFRSENATLGRSSFPFWLSHYQPHPNRACPETPLRDSLLSLTTTKEHLSGARHVPTVPLASKREDRDKK